LPRGFAEFHDKSVGHLSSHLSPELSSDLSPASLPAPPDHRRSARHPSLMSTSCRPCGHPARTSTLGRLKLQTSAGGTSGRCSTTSAPRRKPSESLVSRPGLEPGTSLINPHFHCERRTDQAIIASHPQETRLLAAPRGCGGQWVTRPLARFASHSTLSLIRAPNTTANSPYEICSVSRSTPVWPAMRTPTTRSDSPRTRRFYANGGSRWIHIGNPGSQRAGLVTRGRLLGSGRTRMEVFR
jgi:hypothetical protein